MALHYNTRGFVIKKRNTGEADKIFTIFTDDFGKIDVSGKAIRKITSKLRAGIDIFFLADIEFIQGKTYKTLTDSFPIDKFKSIKKDLDKLKISHKIALALDEFVRGQEKDERIWNLIAEIFEKLEQEPLNNKNRHLFYNYFVWNFFSILGYKPELYKCVICRKKLSPSFIYFSSQDGGIVCQACDNNKGTCPELRQRVNSDTVKVLRLLLMKDWQTLSKLRIRPFSKKLVNDTTKDYYLHLTADFQKGVKVI